MAKPGTKIGWIGIGKMGNPMSRRVLKAGMHVTVYEPISKNRTGVVADGARVANSLAELVEDVDIVVSTIPNDAVLESIVFTANGIAAKLRGDQVFVEMSTVSPVISERVASALRKINVPYLRAPVSGSTATAEAGQLSVIVSGPKKAHERIRPFLDAFSVKQFYVGTGEQARYLKLVLNALVGATSSILAEALAFGLHGGLDIAQMLNVICESAVASPLIAYKREMLETMNFEPAFSVSQMMKDYDLILETARNDHVPMSLVALIRQQYEAAFARGLGKKDFFVLFEEQLRHGEQDAREAKGLVTGLNGTTPANPVT